MTKEEKVIVSAYTGFLMVDFGEFHSYIEKLLDRPVPVHELCEDKVEEEIRDKSRAEFFRLCKEETPSGSVEFSPF